jgi:hypothetical protein
MNKTSAATRRPRHKTVEELLDHEEALAIQRITVSVQRLGGDLCAAADLRRRIRSHPFIATGLAALAGFAGSKLGLRAIGSLSTMTSSLAGLAAQRPITLPGLVMTSLRLVRARR